MFDVSTLRKGTYDKKIPKLRGFNQLNMHSLGEKPLNLEDGQSSGGKRDDVPSGWPLA